MRVNSIECQYIVAVLKEKIRHNELIQSSNVVVTLSENDRSFRI